MNEQNSVGKPVIRLSGISKSFDGKEIISRLDLDVNHGEFLTILGPSGCGKTTVLRMIAGFETADEGQILLDSQDVTSVPAEQRHVNTVFQSYALFPHMTV
ncbi:ATP-binding cassette domain-containing protein, partial [Vibrio alginolyticus]